MRIQMMHEWRLFADMKPTFLLLYQTKMLRAALKHLREALLHHCTHFGFIDVGNCTSKIDMPVPSIDRGKTSERPHVFPVRAHGIKHQATCGLSGILRLPCRHKDARRKALEV